HTYRVLHAASAIGSHAVLYYKGLRGRPRPSQLCPALRPPVPVPGHASWPSGHATQAWLMMLCIEHVLQGVVPGTVVTDPPEDDGAPAPGTGDLGVISSNLRTLARRVARNREIAGLHYASDSAHGQLLAKTIALFLTGMPATSWFGKAVKAAKAEWK
ncbi:MAG TPA: phosphatase PAP2 family protein, partial [Rhodospirillales bacterium]|nr:phosphatase PAP2 family protein [Rhodospirillales bacterium]